MSNQFGNPANPLAHQTTTVPEIFKQLNGKIDAVVCGIGSSGTLTGLTHYFQKVKPDVEMVIATMKRVSFLMMDQKRQVCRR